MELRNLSQLEASVSNMLEQYQTLQLENQQLRGDRDKLLKKNLLAGNKIQAMITKLKGLE